MSTFSSAEGIPVAAGDKLRLTATYDDSLPHVRVMGIMLLYLVPGTVSRCQGVPALPADPESSPSAPPRITVPLLVQPKGPAIPSLSSYVGDFQFARGRVTIRRGATFTWRFIGPSLHDVTLANGPVGFASPSVTAGHYRFRFTVPGTYRLFCSLHPALMTQVVIVR
jgi:plastocyanin